MKRDLPPEGIQCLTGSGGEIGDALVADRRVRKVTFTGSREIGERICRTAGIKKVTMELGSNSPVIVMPDADMEKVAAVFSDDRIRQRRPDLYLDTAGIGGEKSIR